MFVIQGRLDQKLVDKRGAKESFIQSWQLICHYKSY